MHMHILAWSTFAHRTLVFDLKVVDIHPKIGQLSADVNSDHTGICDSCVLKSSIYRFNVYKANQIVRVPVSMQAQLGCF